MLVHLVCAARPNFMKIAPLYHALKKEAWAKPFIVHTGQHYDIDMSDAFFRDLGIPKPDINLEVGSGSHAEQTARVMMAFEPVCIQEKPDWVIVVGDVNSTMACALVASKLGIKVAHVEAGLRSFDRTMPEEINRIVTDSIADLLFTPSEDGDANLMREGIPKEKIKRVGNIMIDTLAANLEKARQIKPGDRFGVKEKNYIFVTLHRPSNVDDKPSLSVIIDRLVKLAEKMPVIFAMHPRTKKNLQQFGIDNAINCSVLIISSPLGYHETIGLVDKARFVLTDSGGLQEETTFLGIPCLTLRQNTERPITITNGTNKLTSLEILEQDVTDLLNGRDKKRAIPELWDGQTAERIIKILKDMKN
jgi:UDP-N-acetylglucosamine 2-epimerase (non-hydrolysing)